MSATIRAQYLDYDLIRSNRLNPIEQRLLQIIVSYSERCSLRQSDLAAMMCRSVATVKRATKSLVEKGFIDKKYTTFKRCVLRVVTMAKQKELMSGFGSLRQIFKRARLRKKVPDSSSVNHLDSSPMSRPTRSETTRNKTSEIDLNFLSKSMGRMSKDQLISEKNRQLNEFRLLNGLN